MSREEFLSLQKTYLHVLDLQVEHCGDHWAWILKMFNDVLKFKIDTELNNRMEVES